MFLHCYIVPVQAPLSHHVWLTLIEYSRDVVASRGAFLGSLFMTQVSKYNSIMQS